MLSYQHAYHAGGPADLLKHLVLVALLRALTRKKRAVSYLETHAGRGLYDLTGPEAAKTREAAEGVLAWEAAQGGLPKGPYGDALRAVRSAYGPGAYPGSPLLARALLRADDRMAFFELHPAEYTALEDLFTDCLVAGPEPLIEKRDGAEGAIARTPPDARRGMVLIDPSYEVKTEYADTAKLALNIITRWPEAMIAIWYPILPAGREAELLQGISGLQPLLFERSFVLKDGQGMTGAGMAVLNAPHGVKEAVDASLSLGAPVLKGGGRRPRPPRR